MNEWEWQVLEDRKSLQSVCIWGVVVQKGDRVRLRPGSSGDIIDLALAGQIAMIESIEQDYEGEIHLTVILDNDPGRDMGLLKQPGHRFFFRPVELEPIVPENQV